MDAKTFFQKVALMRKAQKEYFKTRNQTALRNSKALETEIDKEIERVNNIIGTPQQPKQTNLFNASKNVPPFAISPFFYRHKADRRC